MHKTIDPEMQAFQDDLLEAVRDMKAGCSTCITEVKRPAAADARARVGLSQSQFAALLGVSVRGHCKTGNKDGLPLAQRKHHPRSDDCTLARCAMSPERFFYTASAPESIGAYRSSKGLPGGCCRSGRSLLH